MRLKEAVVGVPESKSIIGVLREKGSLAVTVTTLCVGLALFHIVTSYIGCLEAFQHRSTHLCLMLMIVFLVSSLKRKGKGYLGLNIVLTLLSAISWWYCVSQSIEIPLRLGAPSLWDLIFGTIVILLTLEAARRVVGWAISAIAILFLIYTYFGPTFPGIFKHPSYSFEEIINAQFVDMTGIWGMPLGVMSTFIIIFLIFAGFLMQTGMVDVFINAANKLFGTQTGGPAKVAISASTLVGSISGSAAANVLVTGSISIPTMKRLGYSPTFAGAVEASCSSGGQFMPPIMGASAFIIAVFIGVPYIAVCKAAIIPALLWFFSFFVMVHFEAKKLGLRTMSKEEIGEIRWGSILKMSYLILPLLLLVYLLVIGYTPMYAGFICIVVLLVLSFIRKETRFNLGSFFAAMEYGVKIAFSVTMACAVAGIIVGAVMQSGLGYTLSASLVRISGGQLFLLLPLVLIASLILGFGMTTVGAYIIVATLVAPAMIAIGVVPMAAHLFPFYFAIVSAITPPVAVAAYAAAGLSGASPWSTGVTALRLAIPALAIPFIFVTQPELLIMGDPISILVTLATTIAGIVLLAAAVDGYLLRRATILERIIMTVAAVGFFLPIGPWNLVGLGLGGLVVFLQKTVK